MVVGTVESKITEVSKKFRQIETQLSKENGDFTLFALIEREDSLGKWDVVISAKWADQNIKNVLNLVASKIQSALRENEQIMLSRIVVLPTSDAFVRMMNSFLSVEHGNAVLSNNVINGVLLREAIVITSHSAL